MLDGLRADMGRIKFLSALVGVLILGSASEGFAGCSGSGLSWSCTAGSTVSQVQSAVNSASDGATISFAAGAYSWGGNGISLNNAKGVSLVGAGVGSSVVTVTGTPVIYMDQLSGNNTKTYRISGFTFQNANGMALWFYGPGTLNGLRIDHNAFTNFASGSIAIFFGELSTSAKFFVLIDHNSFTGTNNFMGMKVLGTNDPAQWTSSVRGTRNNVFLEDNTFDFGSATDLGSGCIDAWNSSSVVFRYNTVRNCLVTAHGTTHGGGTVNFEVYGNTLKRQGGDSTWADGTRLVHHQGSGEITVWGNSFVHSGAISDTAISVTHYRSAPPGTAGYSSSLGQCNGTNARDGNTSPSSTYYGWPCWNQPGRAPSGGNPIYGLLSPMYAWLNTDSATGARVDLAIENPWGTNNPSVSTHIKADRDYYNTVNAFNGTTGMGVGTLANRPATCTHTTAPNGENGGGVGYWATDQGEWNSAHAGADGQLYRCSAANSWTLAYVPYTYPHPLQSGGGTTLTPPAAPSNVRIIR
jgi:hypothetical protein